MYVPLFSLYICVEGQASVRYIKKRCMKLAVCVLLSPERAGTALEFK